MRPLITGLAIAAPSLCARASFAQQQRRYEVDPKTKWAVGAKQTPADGLKKRLDAGGVLIIDVRPPANSEKETIPGGHERWFQHFRQMRSPFGNGKSTQSTRVSVCARFR